MQSPTRNPYDIVTEGIISTIPVKFRLQSYVKHYTQPNFPQLPSNFNISRISEYFENENNLCISKIL